MFGFGAFAELPFCDLIAVVTPTPVVVVDTHDGDEKRKKRYQEEVEAKEKKKAELKAIYEELVEGKPRVAEEIAAPYMVVTEQVETATVVPVIDYDRMLSSIDTVEKLYREYQELDDEAVLLLL
jgi:oligoendopeptidase F